MPNGKKYTSVPDVYGDFCESHVAQNYDYHPHGDIYMTGSELADELFHMMEKEMTKP